MRGHVKYDTYSSTLIDVLLFNYIAYLRVIDLGIACCVVFRQTHLHLLIHICKTRM